MGLNFRKSISLGKGLKVNLSKSGPSVSFGKKGLRQTISASGRSTTTVGIPGTGVYYTKSKSLKSLFGGIGDLFGGKDKDDKATKGDKAAKATKDTTKKATKDDTKQTKAAEKEQAKETKEKEKLALAEESQKKIDTYEEYVEAIKSVHKICDDQVDWDGLSKDELPSNIKVGTEEYNEWSTLSKFAMQVVSGDIDAYLAVVEEMKPFDDLLEYGSEFEIGTDDPSEISVEFKVKTDRVVPDYSLSLLASGELSEKPLAKSAYYELCQDYVCSTVIRIARDTFALLPVQKCNIYAVDKVLNSATGNDEEVTILMAQIDRDALANINMDRIDPSDALEALGCKMSFKKTAGFSPIN